MCDYSLQNCKTRDAQVDDEIVSGNIFVDATNYPTSTRGFHAEADQGVAVCLRPGTELVFAEPVRYTKYFDEWTVPAAQTAIFRELDVDQPFTHHDSLEFPDGLIVKVHWLAPGQHARVLQLGVDPKVMRAEGQRAPEAAQT